ncbi:MAG: hypothetical protein FWC95_01525 [Defluviitaleaceae bacterium]|nr:hypothetical protein [Defluviitaleaceae bacterium]
MEVKDYLQLIAIFLTFLVSLVGLITSLRLSAKSRLTSIALTRRKERLDNLVVYSSKFFALAHPTVLNAFTIKQDVDSIRELLENFYTLSGYLDSSYRKDVEIIKCFKILKENSIKYFMKYNRSENKDELNYKYKELYFSNISNAYKLINLFVGTEWERLIIESEKGIAVGLSKWLELYDKRLEDYEAANFTD